LSQIGSQNEATEITQKSALNHTKYHDFEKTKTPEEDEDTRIDYRPEIIA
jgi:hypothetical protein